MLINLGREPEAYDHLIKITYFIFIDNMSYQGFDFFSFRSFTKYALDDIKNNTLSFSHPGSFNDPMDTPKIRFNDIIRPIYQMKLDKSNPFKLIAERIG